VLGDPSEVGIGGEKAKLVADAQLGQDGVDRADLDATTAGPVAELGGFEVVVTGRAPKRATIASWSRGPWNPWSSSW
jgi:hypothetical protein